MAYISPEQVALADADVVFSSSYGGTETPEFKTAFGPAGAGLILDDIETMLAG